MVSKNVGVSLIIHHSANSVRVESHTPNGNFRILVLADPEDRGLLPPLAHESRQVYVAPLARSPGGGRPSPRRTKKKAGSDVRRSLPFLNPAGSTAYSQFTRSAGRM
jgi:hypothetical protein